jgi:membrane protein required for colicin V production
MFDHYEFMDHFLVSYSFVIRSVNWIDIVICIPLVWGSYKGFTKGIIIELATIVALGSGVWLAMKFSELLSSFAKAHWGWDSKYLPVISFCCILLGVLILVYFAGKLVTGVVKAAALGWLNKILGAAFGVLKFALIISILCFVMDAVEKSYPMLTSETKNNSLLYKRVAKIAPFLIPGLKDSKLSVLSTTIDSLGVSN